MTRMTRFWLSLEQGARLQELIEQMEGGEGLRRKFPAPTLWTWRKPLHRMSKGSNYRYSPGEKIHEVFISEDEARTTVELEKCSSSNRRRRSGLAISGAPRGNRCRQVIAIRATRTQNGRTWMASSSPSPLSKNYTRQEKTRRRRILVTGA